MTGFIRYNKDAAFLKRFPDGRFTNRRAGLDQLPLDRFSKICSR